MRSTVPLDSFGRKIDILVTNEMESFDKSSSAKIIDLCKKESYCLSVFQGLEELFELSYVNRKLRYVTKMSLVKIVTIEFETIMIMTPCPWVPKDKWMGCFPTIMRKLTPSILPLSLF